MKGSDLTCIPNKMATFTIAAPSPEKISSLRAKQKKKKILLRKMYIRKVFLNKVSKKGKNDFIKVLT